MSHPEFNFKALSRDVWDYFTDKRHKRSIKKSKEPKHTNKYISNDDNQDLGIHVYDSYATRNHFILSLFN